LGITWKTHGLGFLVGKENQPFITAKKQKVQHKLYQACKLQTPNYPKKKLAS